MALNPEQQQIIDSLNKEVSRYNPELRCDYTDMVQSLDTTTFRSVFTINVWRGMASVSFAQGPTQAQAVEVLQAKLTALYGKPAPNRQELYKQIIGVYEEGGPLFTGREKTTFLLGYAKMSDQQLAEKLQALTAQLLERAEKRGSCDEAKYAITGMAEILKPTA